MSAQMPIRNHPCIHVHETRTRDLEHLIDLQAHHQDIDRQVSDNLRGISQPQTTEAGLGSRRKEETNTLGSQRIPLLFYLFFPPATQLVCGFPPAIQLACG